MRGLLLFSIFLFLAATTLIATHAGVLAWVWIAVMNPHKEVYGFVTSLRLNYLISILAIASWVFSSNSKIPARTGTFWLLIAFVFVTSLSTLYAYDRPFSHYYWVEFLKTFALIYVVACTLNTRMRVHALILVIFASLSFWGVKGGVFSILSGGKYIVYGPTGSHMADNNHLALALTVSLPLAWHLFRTLEHQITKWSVAVAGALSLASVLISYSRGAFLAIVAMGLYWVLSNRRFGVFFAAASIVLMSWIVLPQTWFDRMDTISSYNEDRSALGRFDAWQTSYEIAKAHPITGAGFTAIEIPEVYFSYNPESILGASKAAHSIWFQVLGDHGFLGLGVFALLAFSAWRNLSAVQKMPDLPREAEWVKDLVPTLRLCLIGFWTGGSFLSMAYFDLYFIILVLTGTLLSIARGTSPIAVRSSVQSRLLQ